MTSTPGVMPNQELPPVTKMTSTHMMMTIIELVTMPRRVEAHMRLESARMEAALAAWKSLRS